MLTFPCTEDRGGKMQEVEESVVGDWVFVVQHPRAESGCEPPWGLNLRKTRKPRR